MIETVTSSAVPLAGVSPEPTGSTCPASTCWEVVRVWTQPLSWNAS